MTISSSSFSLISKFQTFFVYISNLLTRGCYINRYRLFDGVMIWHDQSIVYISHLKQENTTSNETDDVNNISHLCSILLFSFVYIPHLLTKVWYIKSYAHNASFFTFHTLTKKCYIKRYRHHTSLFTFHII